MGAVAARDITILLADALARQHAMILTAAVGQVACLAVPGRGAGAGVDAAGLEIPRLSVDQHEGDPSIHRSPQVLTDLRQAGARHGLLVLGQISVGDVPPEEDQE